MTTILGFGPVGAAICDRLLKAGRNVKVVQRNLPPGLPTGIQFQSCDILNPEALKAAVAGSSQVVLAVGFEYREKVWERAWPLAMANTLQACHEANARMVFVDNMYMYGPQVGPLREDMALSTLSGKVGARVTATRLWQIATAEGRVKVAAVRGSDFYGPGALQSQLGAQAFGNLANGKEAMLILPADLPHDMVYVPDFARAVVSLLDAPDDCFNQAWHVPVAPTLTARKILALGAEAIDVPLKISELPLALLPFIGLVSPFMREASKVKFLFDRPYQVDASKFKQRFWSDPTSYEIGAATTARSFLSGSER
jgi:nucleoside-diphosphate-sugar epimerase